MPIFQEDEWIIRMLFDYLSSGSVGEVGWQRKCVEVDSMEGR